jgi:putative ABC transport system permease protein
VKYAVRALARRPAFTAVLLLTLALGIGSSVAIFSVVNAVLLQPLPYANPEELALVWTQLPATNVERALVSGPDMADYRADTSNFEGFAGAMALVGTLTGDGPAEQVVTGYATGNLFDLLGVVPAIGRNLTTDDEFPIDPEIFAGPNPELPPGIVMISHGLWQRRFAGDPAVIGSSIEMDGWGSTIVGVLPADFRVHLPADAAMPTNIDAWGLMPSNLADFGRDAPWLTVVTRLKDGVSVEQGQREMDALALRLRAAHPYHANQNTEILVLGMHQAVVSHARPALLALLGSVAFVLVIACANVANLLLVRAAGREREIAVRTALGGTRGRIIRQMLTESAVLSFGGAAFGVLLAWWGLRAIVALSPGNLPRLDSVAIDARALLFAAVVAAATALAFGMVPALRAARTDPGNALKDRGSVSGGVRNNKVRTGLVIAEVALSMALLIGAGLMLRSFAQLQSVEPGFNSANVVTFTAPLQFIKYPTDVGRTNFMDQLGARLAEISGVEAVGGVTPLPLAGGEQYSVGSYGRVGVADDVYQANKADYKATLPGYFETLGIELLAGRLMTRADNQPDALAVAVVDQRLVDRLFGAEDPLGQEVVVDYFNGVTFEMERRPLRIVGVVANVRSSSLAADSRETIYYPFFFAPWFPLTYVVRTAADPASLLPRIREAVIALDPDVPISGVATMESYIVGAMAQTRFMLALIGAFAVLALVLAALGLYGVISYSVRQRTREIGVRVAFGATDGRVIWMLLRQGLGVALAGIGLGIVGSLALTRLLGSMLVGVAPNDPLTFGSIALLLLLVTAAATYAPARRAARVDPVDALRGK